MRKLQNSSLGIEYETDFGKDKNKQRTPGKAKKTKGACSCRLKWVNPLR